MKHIVIFLSFMSCIVPMVTGSPLYKQQIYKKKEKPTIGQKLLYTARITSAGAFSFLCGVSAAACALIALKELPDCTESDLKEADKYFVNMPSEYGRTSLGFYDSYKKLLLTSGIKTGIATGLAYAAYKSWNYILKTMKKYKR